MVRDDGGNQVFHVGLSDDWSPTPSERESLPNPAGTTVDENKRVSCVVRRGELK